MRVLLQGRSSRSVQTSPGGDQVQIEQTADALRRDFGVDAEVASELEPSLEGFDMVHLFGLTRPQEVWVQARNARKQNKPIVLSTIYTDVWDFERFRRGGVVGAIARHSNRSVIEAMKAAGRGVNAREWSRGSGVLFTRGFTSMQRDVIGMTSIFLPNSESEWRRILMDFAVDMTNKRVSIVPNGVAIPAPHAKSEITFANPALTEIAGAVDGCVLCVARIEGRKNQLNLIEAVRGTSRKLVLAGPPAANQRHFVASVNAAAADCPNVFLTGPVFGPDKWTLLRAAGVHALPSWMETTGLSSLEAAAMGCAVVVSPNGDTRDYFGDDADYCDPGSSESIRSAIERAYRKGASESLYNRVTSDFTWYEAASVTSSAYEHVLRMESNRH